MNVTRTKEPGKLFIVATPIGNLEDITLRAIRTLKEVDLIAAEDTRHTRKLLNHFGIHTRLVSYYREKEIEKGKELIKRIEAGESVALVSDAGSPGISDPGAVLVRMARLSGLSIVPVPGPSAVTAALSVAGLDHPSFLFLGFPPSKKQQRRNLLVSLKNSTHPIVFYESVHRFHHLLNDCYKIFGNRRVFMAREITKSFEQFIESDLDALLNMPEETVKKKGEFVLIIHPGTPTETKVEDIENMLIWYRDQTDMTLKDVSKKLSADLGLSRSQIYQKALLLWKKNDHNR